MRVNERAVEVGQRWAKFISDCGWLEPGVNFGGSALRLVPFGATPKLNPPSTNEHDQNVNRNRTQNTEKPIIRVSSGRFVGSVFSLKKSSRPICPFWEHR